MTCHPNRSEVRFQEPGGVHRTPQTGESAFGCGLRRCVITLLYKGESLITTIRRLGNSRGVIIPKPLLEEAGLDKEAEIALERGAIVLRKPQQNPRQGWAEASRKLVQAGDDELVWPEFSNEDDVDLQW